MATREVTETDFEEVITSNDVVLIDFWASWCGPCRAFAPVYEAVSERYPDVVFAKVDTEAQPALAATFNIMSIPTLMIVRDRVVIFAEAGAMPESALEELLAQARAVDMAEVHRKVAERRESSDSPA
ncbi:MAG: thioredoxin [Acidobacteriota bacterium]|nr:thioredoxin [Acidobacteriota bacterium]